MVHRETDRKTIRGCEQELAAYTVCIRIVGAVVRITVAVEVIHRQSGRDIRAHRNVHGRLEPDLVVISEIGMNISGLIVQNRFLRNIVEYPTGCIAAIKSALRSFQQFDPFDIEQRLAGHRVRAAQVNAVVVLSDSGIEQRVGGQRADTTHENAGEWAAVIGDPQRR